MKTVPETGVAASGGRFEGESGGRSKWQNMSGWVSKNCHMRRKRTVPEVTIPRKGAENAELVSGRTSDFRHLGLWPSECHSTGELVIQPNQLNGDEI